MSHLSLLVSLPDKPESLSILADELSWSPEDADRASRLYATRLPPLVGTSCLSYLFGVSSKLISAMGKFPEPYYRRFSADKRGGGKRQIEAPRRFLKLIQRWINHYVLSSWELPPYVLGFARGRSIFDHGKLHAQGTNLMVVDIEDFFPSVRIDKITRVFGGLGFPDAVARQLASLCSLGERLPQGAPTSPTIANVAFRDADAELKELADSWQCQYSRYADDLAVSGSRHFTQADMGEVESILERYGFAINRPKSRRIGAGGRQIVTGLVVNSAAKPPRWKRRIWRAMFHQVSMHPHEFADREMRLRGIAAFVNQYDPKLASEYRTVADAVAHQLDIRGG
jgi:RNA-directed DNA polymerase